MRAPHLIITVMRLIPKIIQPKAPYIDFILINEVVNFIPHFCFKNLIGINIQYPIRVGFYCFFPLLFA